MLDPSNDGETSHLVGALTQLKSDFVVYTITREWMSHETYTGMLYKTRDEFEKKVVVLNGPKDGSLDFLCMKTTNHLNSDGVPFETFDCGVQATNLVPVVKSIKIKLNP